MGPSPDNSAGLGALVVQNGVLQGLRCALKPLTVIGCGEMSDIRLNIGDIAPLHCVLSCIAGELVVRDLSGEGGTFVNGERIALGRLRDGDTLQLGAVELRLESGGALAPERLPPALHVQAAAVAAQHAAVQEDEARLLQRRAALEKQEEQLAAHLEEKRRKLVTLSERAAAERAALHKERAEYEQYIEKVTGDLGQAQRSLLREQQEVQEQRHKLAAMTRQVNKRAARSWKAREQKLIRREEELANEEGNLGKERERLDKKIAAMVEDRLQFNADYELGRRQLHDAWSRLRRAQHAWRQRRRGELTALKLRERELAECEVALGGAQHAFAKEQTRWVLHKDTLQRDVDGLNQRFKNYRHKLLEQQEHLQRLKQRELAAANALASDAPTPATPSTALAIVSPPSETDVLAPRLATLDRLAAELADQRLQLAEQWQRLVQTQRSWETEQARTAAELENLVDHLTRQQEDQRTRECARLETETILHRRNEELIQLHQQIIGWRARLHAREHTWEGEKARLLADVKHREELAETHLDGLDEIRQRWAQRRRAELDKIRAEQMEYEQRRQELLRARQDVEKRVAALEDEKRALTEKSIAFEHLRKEFVMTTGDPALTERRMDRLRKRWRAQHTAALRALTRERAALQSDLADAEARTAALEQRAAEIAEADADLSEKITAWEHKQIHAETRHARLQQELHVAQAHRAQTEQELVRLRDEIERVARALLDEPELPLLRLVEAA